MADENATVDVVVDGVPQTVSVRRDETLLETMRVQCRATSVRYCCGIGVCGSCTLLLDGEPVSSCLLLTQMVQGRTITTPEGLSSGGQSLVAAQEAFVEAGAFQCSYCIPTMALCVHSATQRNPEATVDDICKDLGGNLCRCGSYPQIRTAIEALVSARITASADEKE